MIVLVMGVSGCGKSTVAGRLAAAAGWTLLEGDSFHPPANVARMAAGTPLTDADRWPWLRAIAAEIDAIRARNESACVACSALKRSYRTILTGGRADMRLVWLRGTQAEIAERLQVRTAHFMPPALLDSQFRTLEEPGPDECPIVVGIAATPDAIVASIREKLI